MQRRVYSRVGNVGNATKQMGRGILAGDARSQSLARGYTTVEFNKVRTVINKVKWESHSRRIKGQKISQHVDSLTQAIWNNEPADFSMNLYTAIKAWPIEADKLKIEISPKSTLTPDNEVTRGIRNMISLEGRQLKVATHAVDVGVDVIVSGRGAGKGQKRECKSITRERRK